MMGILILGVLAGAACSGGDEGTRSDGAETSIGVSEMTPESAVDAFGVLVESLSKGQTGRAYDILHPAQQALFTKEEYEACQSDLSSFDFGGVELDESYPEDLVIPGTDESVESLALTVRIDVSVSGEDADYTDTINAIAVDGNWRFVVDQSAIDCMS